MQDRTEVVDVEAVANVAGNPIPLGLAGLALTVALFGTFNVGRMHLTSLMMATMMLFFGGVVTLIAAILAYRNGDTFFVTLFGDVERLLGRLGRPRLR
jgi:succinate-acetate transporter protein